MKNFLYILAALLLGSCISDNTSTLYDAGISQELALHRKENIHNLQYALHFNIPQQKDSAINANIDIAFTLDKPQEVIIDYREPENVQSVTANGIPTSYKLHNEHLIIPKTALQKGENHVEVTFVAGNQSLNRRDEFLYTLLVPDRARTVFPCFDQPDMKATFTLSLQVPQEWTAVSNSPVVNQSMSEKECSSDLSGSSNKTLLFAPTEPLSTYLFSFVAGKFSSETYNDGKHTFTAYHRETDPHRIAQLPTIFNQVAMSLAWLEEYTGVPYPFAKYDFIILPGFQYGGMEHTGATLYNDGRMFLSKNPPPDEELGRAELIAHETAHMWFGDFVTMKWFNDVWTKEVFANYFAQRITEPLFPGINHRLNWLKSITTSALGEDRTLGGTSIRQPLDNMSNAGLIYNNIIYNKAPVMLEKLVELMGEDAFREGIHEYLVTYGHSNATWDDLIQILDSKCDKDLAAFSDVWVNSNGMPFMDFSVVGDTLVVRQSDPYGRGLTWPQRFKVGIVYDVAEVSAEAVQYKDMLSGNYKEVEVVMSGAGTKVALGGKAQYVLLNSDGRGYGYFRYDEGSLMWMLENWGDIGDETCRQAQLMNLQEAFQHGAIGSQEWLNSLLRGLPGEKNALLASTICGYIGTPLAEVEDRAVEKVIWKLAQEHPLKSCRQQLLRTLISGAQESFVLGELYKIWNGANHPLLGENDYMSLAYELAIQNPEQQKDIIARQAARITNPDRKLQFEFIARATSPDTLEQQQLFNSLLQAENRRVEPWALKTLGYLCHRSREGQAVKYIRPALDSLKYIQRTSDIFFPQNWTRTLLGSRHSEEALIEVGRFFEENPDYPALLRSKILQASWSLQRRAGGGYSPK